MVNSQNNNWLALSPKDELIVMKIKYPVHIMMFGMVSSNSDIINLLMYLHGLRLNTEANIKCLEEVVLIWIERVVAERPDIWKQDSALCHTNMRTSS